MYCIESKTTRGKIVKFRLNGAQQNTNLKLLILNSFKSVKLMKLDHHHRKTCGTEHKLYK